MKKFLVLFCSIFIIGLIQTTLAQDDLSTYKIKVKEAWQLYKTKEFKKSADTYAEAFAAFGRKAYSNDRYNAACSYALAGQKDSALFHLYRLANGMNYTNLDHITTDSDLKSLYNESKWDEIIELVTANKEEAEKNFDKPLTNLLDSLFKEDQGIRGQYEEMTSKYERDSDELKAYFNEMNEIDRRNEAVVTKILDEYGWLGSELVGGKGNTTLFLVIQHAPIETQQKYLPMMRQAVKDKKAKGSSLALLEDRVNLRTGKKQIYGSQIGSLPNGKKYVQALEDPLNVDKRRAKVGLGSLNDYTQNWDFSFDPEEYLKKLPEYEALLNKK